MLLNERNINCLDVEKFRLFQPDLFRFNYWMTVKTSDEPKIQQKYERRSRQPEPEPSQTSRQTDFKVEVFERPSQLGEQSCASGEPLHWSRFQTGMPLPMLGRLANGGERTQNILQTSRRIVCTITAPSTLRSSSIRRHAICQVLPSGRGSQETIRHYRMQLVR